MDGPGIALIRKTRQGEYWENWELGIGMGQADCQSGINEWSVEKLNGRR